jgi:hypothetical protein
LDQLETAANDLILIIQEYNKQNQAPNWPPEPPF